MMDRDDAGKREGSSAEEREGRLPAPSDAHVCENDTVSVDLLDIEGCAADARAFATMAPTPDVAQRLRQWADMLDQQGVAYAHGEHDPKRCALLMTYVHDTANQHGLAW